MDLVQGFDSLPLAVGPTAVTIGFFDGVHRGHQTVLRRTVAVARARGLLPVAVTFDRHPREILTPGAEPRLLTTLDRKASLIAEVGIGALIVLEFTEEFSRWPPEDFVRRVLVEGARAEHAVVGSNFTFGHKARGNLAVLTDLGAANGFSVEAVSLLKIDGRPVSSSSIREALVNGDLEWPTEALGRRYVLDGTVTTGAGRGRGLGFPTANLGVSPRMLLPGEGVYAGKAHVGEGSFLAAINVGTNPTFGGEPLHAEAFLLDFEGDLIGRPMALEFWERLRDEARFDSAEDLARQIKDDVERTRALVA
ncbi:MAG TPA: bifunctional riboflavin kinase/FAD synthetase [Actinomycetota bacterium]|jgi:riboflavin kinase/FMN adenylyltransferase